MIKPIPESWLSKARCTTEELQDLYPLVIELLYLHQKAQRIGLLSLYDNLDGIEDKFLKKALSLALEGYDASLIDTILTNIINHDDLSGRALMARIIIKDGVLSLALGNTPQAALELFLSILNPPGTSDILEQALDRWKEEKADYFGEDEIQAMRNIIQFRKG